MKKLLLSSAALCGLAMVATPAAAQVSLDLGGHFKGYAFYTDQDDDTAVTGEARELDIIRQTELHFSGETTLNNGLTVGAHIEAEVDRNGGGTNDSFDVEETYAYFSGSWGRFNVGSEDGASYLLQVAVPSADNNIDGIRQFVNPVNHAAADPTGALAALDVNGARGGLDYDQDVTGYADKITYLSPIMNGFQLGLSYTPDVLDASDEDATNLDDVEGVTGTAYEVGLRYEGNFNNVGVIVGAGYTHVDQEAADAAIVVGDDTDDRQAWNVGVDLDIGPFGVGVSYSEDNFGELDTSGATPSTGQIDDEETLAIGVDYTTGPFKFGASYLDIENTGGIAGVVSTDGIESSRYTGGVVYTYGPGMTLRGSVSHVEHEDVAGLTSGDEIEATSVTVGTQINF